MMVFFFLFLFPREAEPDRRIAPSILVTLATSHNSAARRNVAAPQSVRWNGDAREEGQRWSKKSDLMCSNRALCTEGASLCLTARKTTALKTVLRRGLCLHTHRTWPQAILKLCHISRGLTSAPRMYNLCAYCLVSPKPSASLIAPLFFFFLTSPSREKMHISAA